MAKILNFPSARIPTAISPFVPDAEVHRIRQELQIIHNQPVHLRMRQLELEALYDAAMDAANPEQLFSPEYIAAPSEAFD